MTTDSNIPTMEGDVHTGAVQERENRYQNLFMTSEHAAFICDTAHGAILDANQAAERLYGYTRQEFLTMKISALSAANGSACPNTPASPGQTSPLRYHRKSSGTVFPVEASSATFVWQNKRCRFEIYRDLAERRRLENELRSGEARLKLFLDAMHDGLVDWDLATDEMSYSPGWISMLGYGPDEVPPYAFFLRSIVHRDDTAHLRSALNDHIGGRTAKVNIELRLRAKDRAWKWMECRGSVVEWDEKGAPRRFIATFADIGERKAAEERTREFRAIIMSEVYEKLFIKLRVFRHGESMAMNLNRLLLFAQNITDLHAALRRQHESGTPAAQIPAAQRVHVAVNEYNLLVYPELRSIGLLLQAIGDENPPAEGDSMPQASGRELLKLNENVNQLVGKMKEVLTNPKPEPLAVDVKALRMNMLRHVDSLKHHVSSLMKLVESELACDACKTVETAVGKYAPNSFGIPVEFTGLGASKFVIGKPGEIGEIVSILIHNSLEAMDGDRTQARDEKRIAVKCGESGGRVVVTVEDTGPGVCEMLREKIFEDGFTTKSNGHGFGLSYARSTLKKFGGRITYEPNAPRGARFLIELIVLN